MTTKKKSVVLIRRHSVSLATLEGLGACDFQRTKFRLAFNVSRLDRVKITAENVLHGKVYGLMFEWLFYRVFSQKAIILYNNRRHTLHDRLLNAKITGDQYNQQLAELQAKMLREYWGTRWE